jgi:Amt family ammonium transporter
VFFLIRATIGLRVSAADEEAGLDISETGMYGYPEQFIPPSELVGAGLPAGGRTAQPAPSGAPATAMTGEARA